MRTWIGWKPTSPNPHIASVRIRCMNPLRVLQAQGYPVELFNPERADRYAVALYSKRYDEESCREAAALRAAGAHIVFDLCDNRFYNPNGLRSLNHTIRQLRRMLSTAHMIVTSTDTLADVIRSELQIPTPIRVIEDAVETEIVCPNGHSWQCRWHEWGATRLLQRLVSEPARTPLVWFGHHGSSYADGGMADLLKIRSLLERLNRQWPLSLTVISNSQAKYFRWIKPWALSTHYLAWHPHTFLKVLRSHAIAVIPITDTPFTRCKTNNRLALALQEGLAVVADAIPSYQPFASFAALDQWEAGLAGYLTDPNLRRRHVEEAQTLIAEHWMIRPIAAQWRTLFDHLRGNRTAKGCNQGEPVHDPLTV